MVKKMRIVFNPYVWTCGAITVFVTSLARASEVAQEQFPAWLGMVEGGVQQLGTPIVATIVIMLIEACLRLFKTKDPKSLLYFVANAFKILGLLLTKLALILDKVAQRTKDNKSDLP